MVVGSRIEDFAAWFVASSESLRKKPAEQIAEAVATGIGRVDPRLGIELSKDKNTQELIITAYSEPSLFGTVHRIVQLIGTRPGWRLIALKPPRGFAFTISVGKHRVQATSLEFAPIAEIAGGIRLLLLPSTFAELATGQDAEELGWLIVETGIGEELASRIHHVEFGNSYDVVDRRPIGRLADFVNGLL